MPDNKKSLHPFVGFPLSNVPYGDSAPFTYSEYEANFNPFDIRSIGFRMPMVGVGWGYDIDGFPVPNENPEEPTDKFIGPDGEPVPSGSMSDPSQYVAGPIDLKWDHNNGVWRAASALVFALSGTPHEEEADQQWSFEWKEAHWGDGINSIVEKPNGLSSFNSELQEEDSDLRAWLMIGAIPIEDYELPPSDENACETSISINEQTYSLASSILIRKPLKSGTPILLQLVPRANNKPRWTIVNILPRLCPYCPSTEEEDLP